MNVNSSYPPAAVPARYDGAAAGRNSEPAMAEVRSDLRAVSDQVVISHKARVALNEMRRMPDVDLTIKALISSAPLTERRAGEVLRRIQQGYYRQPQVLREMATVLSDVLEREP